MSLHYSSGAWQPDELLCHALRARSGVEERTHRIPLLSFKTLLSADSTRGEERLQAGMCRAVTGSCDIKACARGEMQRVDPSLCGFFTCLPQKSLVGSHVWIFFSLRNKERNKGESSSRRPINVAQGLDTRTIFCRIGHVNPKAIHTHGLITQCTKSLCSLHLGLLFLMVNWVCRSMGLLLLF